MIAFLRTVALVVFLACMAWFATGERSWFVLVVALLASVVVFFTSGAGVVFTRGWWFGTAEQDAECARIDAEVSAWERCVRESERGVR